MKDGRLVTGKQAVKRPAEDVAPLAALRVKIMAAKRGRHDHRHQPEGGRACTDFRFERLVNWGNGVLVAHLRPADERSAETLSGLVEERARLTWRFRERFGIGPSETYSPHVSLGYFANREAGQLSVPCLEAWNRVFGERMQGMILSLGRVGVYGFTDMATFFRVARDPERD